MVSLETAIRLIVIGQELLLALLFLSGQGKRSARISGALFLVSVAAYLVTSSPELRTATAAALPIIMLLSVADPYFLWTFAKCIFDSPLPPLWVMVVFVTVGVTGWLVFVFADYLPETWMPVAITAVRGVSLVIVVNTLWLSAIGRRDDLLEKRRRFRTIFVTLVSVQVTAVLIVELFLAGQDAPQWLSLLNAVLIGLMTMGISVPLLRLSDNFFPAREQPRAPQPEPSARTLSAADRVLFDKLTSAMDDGLYRRTGLTISALADELGYPEHQLRRLINRHLGFRNFSFFLNSLRIEEATSRLADPDQARVPILTIALDLGYGSLGPFNRAFKAFTGTTPSAYREQAIPASSE